MGIISRFGSILEANINDFLDGLEDKNAEKMIDQKIREMREQLAKVQSQTATVMANATARKRNLDECDKEIKKYANAAMNAVKAGADDDARKLLEKKQSLETKRTGLEEAYKAANQDSSDLQAVYNKLISDIQAAEDRADVLKGKLASAKARETVNEVAKSAGSVVSTEGFDRLEGRVNQRLDKANATAKLADQRSDTEDLAAKYCTSTSSSVEDELAKMKAQLGGQQ